MILTLQRDLHSVKVNQHVKYLGQRSLRLKVSVCTPHTHTHTHTHNRPIAIHGH